MGLETVLAVGVPLVMSYLASQSNKSGDAAVGQANQNKLQLMGQAQKDLGNYRPQLMKAQMGAMNQRLGAYRPAQDALATMYGGGKAPMGMLPDPAVLAQGKPLSGMNVPGSQMNPPGMRQPFASGPLPMPSAPPQRGNGPPMGSPQRGLPDPSTFLLGRRGAPT